MSNELAKLGELLDLLSTEQKMLSKLGMGTLLKSDQIEESYEAWVGLLNKLSHPHERNFFRSTWVPICFDDYFFIDVSQENWCIFDAAYWSIPKRQKDMYWYKVHYFINMEELIHSLGDYEHLKYLRNQNRDPRLNIEWKDNLI